MVACAQRRRPRCARAPGTFVLLLPRPRARCMVETAKPQRQPRTGQDTGASLHPRAVGRSVASPQTGIMTVGLGARARKRAVITTALAALLIGGAPTSIVRAQSAPDPSDVVIVLDFSASILDVKADRNRFGAALERIADRVDETSSDLVAGDTTASIVQFAAKAADYPGCTELKLLGSPEAVAKFARCLRSVAAAYRRGLSPVLTRRIGVDTNYVAAMDRAAKHL